MRFTYLIPLSALLATASGCIIERSHRRYYRDEVVIGPAPVVIVENDVDYGPPPPVRVEVIGVQPFYGAVWVPGHWVCERHRREWFWVGGHWR
jgi:hypothetical protein